MGLAATGRLALVSVLACAGCSWFKPRPVNARDAVQSITTCDGGRLPRRAEPFHLAPGRGVVWAPWEDEGTGETAPEGRIPGDRWVRSCSHASPPEFNAPWTPDRAVVDELETRFVALEDRVRGDIREKWSISDYHRWYVGYVRDGRRFIYVYAVSSAIVEEANGGLDRWGDRWIVVCDGGWAAWSVVYDVASRCFANMSVNGEV